MLSPAIYLLLNGLFFTLRLSGGGGSFPRPLKAEEEREYLQRTELFCFFLPVVVFLPEFFFRADEVFFFVAI